MKISVNNGYINLDSYIKTFKADVAQSPQLGQNINICKFYYVTLLGPGIFPPFLRLEIQIKNRRPSMKNILLMLRISRTGKAWFMTK